MTFQVKAKCIFGGILEGGGGMEITGESDPFFCALQLLPPDTQGWGQDCPSCGYLDLSYISQSHSLLTHTCTNSKLEAPPPGKARAVAAPELLEVRPGLYPGRTAAGERSRLREAGIAAVLTVDTEEPGGPAPGLRTPFVRAPDEPDADPLSHLDHCVAFVVRARALPRSISGSAAVVTAYLMKAEQLPSEEAYGNLQTVKPEAKMNEGFEWQLKLYQTMGCKVDTSNALFKQYRLQKVTEKYPELQNLPQEVFAVDPTLISQDLKDEFLYKCRKCSSFAQSAVLSWVPSTSMVNSVPVFGG
ncbi:dual specificity protein phosphatase 12-like [Macrotis lagotis]|uniref:dual specificity protein phosphatase 12-like n=1 Tax=Macrotis lagotis TaxID=92651 RepID=UPI003D68E807